MEKTNEIIDHLVNQGIIHDEDIEFGKLTSGTTNGTLFTIKTTEIPKYVVKIDQPEIISTTEDFLLTYKDVTLLPNVLYTDEKKEFIVYSYVFGETHINRGSKLAWMTTLIEELLNKYEKVNKDTVPYLFALPLTLAMLDEDNKYRRIKMLFLLVSICTIFYFFLNELYIE